MMVVGSHNSIWADVRDSLQVHVVMLIIHSKGRRLFRQHTYGVFPVAA